MTRVVAHLLCRCKKADFPETKHECYQFKGIHGFQEVFVRESICTLARTEEIKIVKNISVYS